MNLPRRLMRRSFLAIVFATMPSCVSAAQYRAVTLTSKAGARLRGDAHAMLVSLDICNQRRALRLSHRCPEDSDKWIHAVDVLVAYSFALDRLANDGKRSIGDDPAGDELSVARLTSGGDPDVGKLAKVVAALVSATEKRHTLSEGIHQADPVIQTVTQHLLGHLQQEQDQLDDLRCKIACDAGIRDEGRCPQNPPDCHAEDDQHALWFAGIGSELDRRADEINIATRDVTAYASAHAELEKDFGNVDDVELEGQIFGVLSKSVSAQRDAGASDGVASR